MSRPLTTVLVVVATLLSLLVLPGRACWVPSDLTPEEQQWAEALKLDYNAAADPMGCSPEEASWQAQQWQADLQKKKLGSACANHWWLSLVAALKLNGTYRHTTIADIGCNKAYFSGEALAYFAPDYGNHVAQLHESHKARGVYSLPCGMCGECLGKPENQPTEGQDEVEILCVEPSETHVASITLARDKMYGPPNAPGAPPGKRTQVKLHVMHGAASNETGEARFPKNCTVNDCSLADNPQNFETVPVTTVDTQMNDPSGRWKYLDVLKIDVEGFDPLVLSGAYRSLAAHKIKALVFEYNDIWYRTKASLKQCTRYLEDLGYACFYDNQVLSRISGTCWNDAYEMKFWSNVVCTVRGTALEGQMMAGSWLSGKVAHVPQPAHHVHGSGHIHHKTGGGMGVGGFGHRAWRNL